MGLRNGVVGEGEEGLEVVAVGEEVGLDLGADLEGVGLEALDEEAEIGCGERGAGIGEVVRGEEVSDVDCVEEGIH